MKGKPDITAGGAVILRSRDGRQQVLVVHRPRYDDWSLPKGKIKPDELPQVAAVREVREETGVKIALRMRLADTAYKIGNKTKVVIWWVGTEIGHETWSPDHEIDKRVWMDIKKARKLMTYDDEKQILDRALESQPVIPFLIVRHAKAMARENWSPERDHDRRLTERGRRQSKALVDLLECYQVERLVSSSSTRCVDTLKPISARLNQKIEKVTSLSEERAAKLPDEVAPVMRKLFKRNLKQDQVTVVCGHRPVFPLMFDAIGVVPQELKPAELAVCYFLPDGTLCGVESVRSKL